MNDLKRLGAGSHVVAFAAGAATAALAARLLAPRCGETTRARIGSLAKSIRDRSRRVPRGVGTAQEELREAIELAMHGIG